MIYWNFIVIIAFLFFVGGFVYIFRRMRQSRTARKQYLHLTDKTLAEAFLMLSVLFFSVTLFSFNKTLHQSLAWQTIVLLTAAIAIIYAYFFRIRGILVFGLLVLACWWVAQAEKWIDMSRIKPAPMMLGLVIISALYYFAGRLHEGRRRFGSFAPVYVGLGLLIASLLLFFLSTSMGLEFLQDMTTGAGIFSSWRAPVWLGLLLILLFAAVFVGHIAKRISLVEDAAWAAFVILFVVISFLPMQEVSVGDRLFRSTLSNAGIAWAILFNSLFFLEMVGLILVGYEKQDERLVNAGALFIFIFVFVKYIDWFFKFLDKSVFFLGAGVLLLVLGWFMERGRRYMLTGLKQAR